VAERAALVARWTNTAREMVDAPANLMSPATLSDRVVNFAHLVSEIVDPVRAGLE
jgi:leucyl aminopeptidase